MIPDSQGRYVVGQAERSDLIRETARVSSKLTANAKENHMPKRKKSQKTKGNNRNSARRRSATSGQRQRSPRIGQEMEQLNRGWEQE